jgi:hypothetical protein
MSVSRREFLLRGSILAAGVVLPVTALAQQSKFAAPARDGGPVDSVGANAPALWSKASFLSAVGSEFAVQQSENQKVYLLLNSVEDFNLAPTPNPASMTVAPKRAGVTLGSPGTENFMLNFRASLAQPLKQGPYPFTHPVLGALTLFIVPDGRSTQNYVAVVNRIVMAPSAPGTVVDHTAPPSIQPGPVQPPTPGPQPNMLPGVQRDAGPQIERNFDSGRPIGGARTAQPD